MWSTIGDKCDDDSRRRPQLRCPACNGPVVSTGSGPGWMSPDQWESSKAGDYFCNGKCENPARENRLAYFWHDDVMHASVCAGSEIEYVI